MVLSDWLRRGSSFESEASASRYALVGAFGAFLDLFEDVKATLPTYANADDRTTPPKTFICRYLWEPASCSRLSQSRCELVLAWARTITAASRTFREGCCFVSATRGPRRDVSSLNEAVMAS